MTLSPLLPATPTTSSDSSVPCAASKVVVIAASHGGLDAGRAVLENLPAQFSAAVVLVQHRAHQPDLLCRILRERTVLPVEQARHGDLLRPGTIYVAPPSKQVRVTGARQFVVTAEDTTARPGCAADPLFQSAAAAWGPNAVGVVLSGRLQDGAAGVRAIKRAGGAVLVQDPATARASSMPDAAMSTGCVVFVLAPPRIAVALVALTMMPGASSVFGVPAPSWALPA